VDSKKICPVKVVAVAGGVGAGKFLRGLTAVVPPEDVSVVINTGDDLLVHGLHVSPDLDSVTYWLAGVMDRDRGWGRSGETFRATEQLRAFGAEGAWFGLGDLDLATHLYRTTLLAEGRTLTQATRSISTRLGVRSVLLPMTDDPVATRVVTVDAEGHVRDLHFQEYWVLRGARDEVTAVYYEGARDAEPAPGVLDAIAAAEVVLLCPSNPIASIDPILALPQIREAIRGRREIVGGVSPIVGGTPLRGMADKLLPAAGVEVSTAGVAEHYRALLGSFVIDEVDRASAGRIGHMLDGRPVAIVDTVMVDDEVAAQVAKAAIGLVESNRRRLAGQANEGRPG
jgi:LPPG:FO 2-phospho-L-lactate transferase